MKVLISAIACSPEEGSESFIGWNAVQALAKDHDLWVMTSSRYRDPIMRAKARGAVPGNVQFVFHGSHRPWHRHRLTARLQSWREYATWTETLLPAARALHDEIQFDLAHHVTISTWRIPSPLWQLPIPFVWGPVGGAGSTPLRFLPTMSASGMAFELARAISNRRCITSKLVACARKAAVVLASNQETQEKLSEIRGHANGVQTLCPAYFSADKINRFASGMRETSANESPLRLFAGGNLIGSKGVALALRGLAKAKTKGLKFIYTLAGGGPEEKYLRKLAAQLGLAREVKFVNSLSGDAYVRELGESDVYLLPSFRENVGLTMMEAMLAGCVPVVADCSAPSEIVGEDCGYKVPVRSVDSMTDQIAGILLRLNKNRPVVREMGKKASHHIQERYSEARYRTAIGNIYRSVVSAT